VIAVSVIYSILVLPLPAGLFKTVGQLRFFDFVIAAQEKSLSIQRTNGIHRLLINVSIHVCYRVGGVLQESMANLMFTI
jgi:hypothetical protein